MTINDLDRDFAPKNQRAELCYNRVKPLVAIVLTLSHAPKQN